MYPASFEYFAPSTLDEALSVLERYGDEAKILAGGQSLIPLMKLRFASPRALVDINGISDLGELYEDKILTLQWDASWSDHNDASGGPGPALSIPELGIAYFINTAVVGPDATAAGDAEGLKPHLRGVLMLLQCIRAVGQDKKKEHARSHNILPVAKYSIP